MIKFIYLAAITAVVFMTLAKGDDFCEEVILVYNYDTDKQEKCVDQNLTFNPKWKEFQ